MRIGATYFLVLAILSTVVSCKEPLECPVARNDWYELHNEFKLGCQLDSDCIVPRVKSPGCMCGGEAYVKDRIEEVEAIYSCIDCTGEGIPICPVLTNECVAGSCVAKPVPE